MARLTPQWLQAGSYTGNADRRLMSALWPTPATTGCLVTVATGMSVNIAPGELAVPVTDGTTVLCTSTAVETVALAVAPPSGTDRQDLIICTPRSAEFGGANEDFIFDKVQGAQGTPPGVVPATPAGSLALARVHVRGGAASLLATDLTDLRGVSTSVDRLVAARLYAADQTVMDPGIWNQVLQLVQDYAVGPITTANNAIKIGFGGIYLLTCGSMFQSGGSPVGGGSFASSIYVNGEQALIFGPPGQWTAPSYGVSGGAGVLRLNSGDLLTLYAFQSTAGAAGTNPGTQRTWLDATRLGPAA